MSAFLHLGHQSINLISEPTLQRFGGIILSPVNYTLAESAAACSSYIETAPTREIYLDPQLYVPSADRGCLQQWPHFPADLDTHDVSSLTWWSSIIDRTIEVATNCGATALCSPMSFPRAFTDSFFSTSVDIGNRLVKQAPANMRPVLTAMLDLRDLARTNRHLEVASIISQFEGEEIYVLLSDGTPPRQERTDSSELESAARLIRLLRRAGYSVTIGHTSSEMILWKHAQANNVASGKFFNLRRFVVGRFDEEEAPGGRNLPYWTEPSLLAFLREGDLRRFMQRGLPLSPSHQSNPHSQNILRLLDQPSRPAWLGESWRQFLYWFSDCENQLDRLEISAAELLHTAERTWQDVHEQRLLMDQPFNDGSWIRPWRIVLEELDARDD